MIRARDTQPVSTLARWIVAGEIVSLVWQSRLLLPLFQFKLPELSLRRGVSAVIAELNGVFDDQGLAIWFARPNSLLGGETPVDLIAREPAAVLQAARADRFAFLG
jgi:hypothetical protein